MQATNFHLSKYFSTELTLALHTRIKLPVPRKLNSFFLHLYRYIGTLIITKDGRSSVNLYHLLCQHYWSVLPTFLLLHRYRKPSGWLQDNLVHFSWSHRTVGILCSLRTFLLHDLQQSQVMDFCWCPKCKCHPNIGTVNKGSREYSI